MPPSQLVVVQADYMARQTKPTLTFDLLVLLACADSETTKV